MTGSRTALARTRTTIHVPADSKPRSAKPEVVVELGDAVDTLRELRERLPVLLSRGQGPVIVDLSEMTQLSSDTVATLLWLRRRCRSHGMDVVLRHPSRCSVDLLGRTGLRGALPVEQQDIVSDPGRAESSSAGGPAR